MDLLEACKFLMSFVPDWAKEVPPGLFPMSYGTLTYDGDLKVKQEVDKIKALIEEEEKNTEFENLPIILDDTEKTVDGWSRNIRRPGTVAELLEIWDIDDEYEDSAMAQVLRHLRRVMQYK
ncbi:MAG: hypothetical protein PVG39_02430 [Desulfobacteraceae bacterium]